MNLSTEQLQLIEKLKSGLYSYQGLSEDEKQLLRQTVRPDGCFTNEQKQLLSNFYLVVENLEFIKSTLTLLNLDINPIETLDGLQVINADLLTDCLEPSDTWYSIRNWLATMTIKYLLPEDFPIND